MKPFNLEAAKAGAPVITRSGLPTRIICFDRKSPYSIVSLVLDGGAEKVITNTTEGSFHDLPHRSDLFMAPVKRTGWINIYSDQLRGGAIHKSKEDAQQSAIMEIIDTIQITWEEE